MFNIPLAQINGFVKVDMYFYLTGRMYRKEIVYRQESYESTRFSLLVDPPTQCLISTKCSRRLLLLSLTLDHVFEIEFTSLVRTSYHGTTGHVFEPHLFTYSTKVIKLFWFHILDYRQVIFCRSKVLTKCHNIHINRAKILSSKTETTCVSTTSYLLYYSSTKSFPYRIGYNCCCTYLHCLNDLVICLSKTEHYTGLGVKTWLYFFGMFQCRKTLSVASSCIADILTIVTHKKEQRNSKWSVGRH
jgi:hypothetical protein